MNTRGMIRARVVALLLLILSVSMINSAYRSLSREFHGVVISKSLDEGISKAFWLFITPASLPETSTTGKTIIQNMLQNAPTRRVGVSRLVYVDVHIFHEVSKTSFSPYIFVEGTRHLDLGLQWLTWGLLGCLASMLIYRQATISKAFFPGEPENSCE